MKTTKNQILLVIICLISIASWSQELPAIFKNTPKKILESNTLATFPQKTFLENLILLPDGNLLVNSHFEGVVYKIDTKGNQSKLASVNGKVTGIAAYGKDKFILTGNDENDKPELYLLNNKGTIEKLMDLPDGIFLNGIAHFKNDDFLIADSYKGCIWKVNVKTKTVTNWLENDLLKRSTDKNPTPAANGIKMFKNKIYVSNTQKQLLLQIGIANDKPLEPEIYAKEVNIDDFTFDDIGNLYATTHVYNSIIKITPNKTISIIAEQPQGVSGSTACVLQKAKTGLQLYVSTNGGMYLPPPTGIENSKIVVLKIN
jgi:hypothetical protein